MISGLCPIPKNSPPPGFPDGGFFISAASPVSLSKAKKRIVFVKFCKSKSQIF
jgi:hypothetical protein